MNLIRLVYVLFFVSIAGCATSVPKDISERTFVPSIVTTDQGDRNTSESGVLKLVSINLAHGRKDSLNQWLVSQKKTLGNLDDIAVFLMDVDADVVALQEADAPSAWSGKIDHVAYLAEKAGFGYFTHGEHAQIVMGNYGTAILSRWPIEETIGLTFPATPPTTRKGFTLAKIRWQNSAFTAKPVLLDVVSVHLDFSRKTVRRHQVDELVATISSRNNPLVIMGDFNSEWLARSYTVDSFADSSEMHVYEAASEELNTYKDKRLDWILLSREIEFNTYRTEDSVLSDHKAIVAGVELVKEPG